MKLPVPDSWRPLKKRVKQAADAHELGHKAWVMGLSRDTNPHDPGTEEYKAWNRGWRSASLEVGLDSH